MARQQVLIITDVFDENARALTTRLGEQAVIVTPLDLSRPGWTFHHDTSRRTGCNSLVAFTATKLSAVIIRIVAVFPGHIPHVVARDREYVAAEMTAFLRAWLTGLSCPMLNSPTALCLSGPAWEMERWAMLGHRMGVPFVPMCRTIPMNERVPLAGSELCTRVVVVGNEVVPDPDCSRDMVHRARALANYAGVYCAAVYFDRSGPAARVVSVDCWPNLSETVVLDALIRTLNVSQENATALPSIIGATDRIHAEYSSANVFPSARRSL
jgi:hypothetical protein